MKKLMILAAVACAATFANATAIRWNFVTANNKNTPGDYASNYADFTGMKVYAILSQPAEPFSSVDDITGTWSEGTQGNVGTISTPNNRKFHTDTVVLNSSDLAARNTTQNFYLVLVDDTNGRYWITDQMSAVTFDPNQDTATDVAVFNNYSKLEALSDPSKWTSFAAVPEPTSGLLLLLGVAGLALKRKRA